MSPAPAVMRPFAHGRYTFKGGANGTLVPSKVPTNPGSTPTTPDTSGTEFDTTTPTVVYDQSHSMHGVQAGKFTGGSYAQWFTATIGSRTKVWARGYVYYDATPPGSDAVLCIWNGDRAVDCASVKVAADGHVFLQAGAAASTYAASGGGVITVGNWYRIELAVDCTAKTAQYKVYLGDETTPIATSAVTTISDMPSTASSVWAGCDNRTWIDDMAYSFSGWIGPAYAPGATVPGAPSSFTATAGALANTLSWTQGAQNQSAVIRNKIYRSTTAGGPYTLLATIVQNTTYTDGGLTAGTTYYYRVTAVNSMGESAQSAEASATPTSGFVAPTLVSQSSVAENNTITAPTSIASGNVLIATYYVQNGSANVTFPSGFTVAGTWKSGNGGAGSWGWGWKIATGSEPSTYVFSNSAGTSHVAINIRQYPQNSLKATGPIDTVAGTNAQSIVSTSTPSPAAPSVTPSVTGEVLIAAVASFNGRTVSAGPAGMTFFQEAHVGGSESIGTADLLLSSTSATGTKSFTWASADTGGAIAYCLVPGP